MRQELASQNNRNELLHGKAASSSSSVAWMLSRPKHASGISLSHTFTWTNDDVFVTFSNLQLSVIRIPLASSVKVTCCRTLHSDNRIYLPASSRERQIHFYPYFDGDRNEYAYILPWDDNFDPPTLILLTDPTWVAVEDNVVDFTMKEDKEEIEFYEATEESFVIPVRSGLEWTERVVLNCQT